VLADIKCNLQAIVAALAPSPHKPHDSLQLAHGRRARASRRASDAGVKVLSQKLQLQGAPGGSERTGMPAPERRFGN
jgi:hypothetical protein